MHVHFHCPLRPPLMAMALVLVVASRASAGDAAAPGTTTQASAVKLEAIPGSSAKRITLTARAVERLGIQTGLIGEDVVIRKQMVSGMVIYPGSQSPGALPGGSGFGGFGRAAGAAPPQPESRLMKVAARDPAAADKGAGAAAPPRGDSVVVVNLSAGEFERIAKDRPARISPLYTRDKDMTAMLSDQPPIEDSKRSMLSLHYKLPSSDHGLPPSSRVRVELQLAGSEDKQKVAPYSALYYDAKGVPWVYVNAAPLVYERQRVGVQRVVGNVAVLSDGPAVGTPVVTVGAALLYGTEIFGK